MILAHTHEATEPRLCSPWLGGPHTPSSVKQFKNWKIWPPHLRTAITGGWPLRFALYTLHVTRLYRRRRSASRRVTRATRDWFYVVAPERNFVYRHVLHMGLSTGCRLPVAQAVAAAAVRCFGSTIMGSFCMTGMLLQEVTLRESPGGFGLLLRAGWQAGVKSVPPAGALGLALGGGLRRFEAAHACARALEIIPRLPRGLPCQAGPLAGAAWSCGGPIASSALVLCFGKHRKHTQKPELKPTAKWD
jgi:hypothetical protein